jgi:hypothetical protein
MNLKNAGFTAISALFSLGAGVLARAEAPRVWAIENARIVRVSGPAIAEGTVLLRDGVIEAVGAKVKTPADAWIIDGKGLTVYPGLIDGLSTIGLPGANVVSTARGGRAVTSTSAPFPSAPPARGPQDRPSNFSYIKAADQIAATDASIATARDGGYTTAFSFPTGNIFSGQGSAIDLRGDNAGQMVVAPSVGQFITLRTLGFASYPGSLMGVIAYIRQMYLDADHYKLANQIYASHPQGLERPGYDRTVEGVIESPRILLPAQRKVEIERMLNFGRELHQKFILYGGDEAWRTADELKAAGVPVLISLRWPERDRTADPADQDALRILEMRDKAPDSPAALAHAGVKFALYSGGPINPKDQMKAVRRAIEHGLSAEDALRAMTLSPAEMFGLEDRLGSIDKGKIANLVIADGDLFGEKTKIKFVFEPGMPDAPAAPRKDTTEENQ